MNTYVLSIIGADRAGLVEALSEVVAKAGGSWERSHMAELAGQFAGMVLVRLPGDREAELRAGIEPLREQGLLDVTLRPAGDDAVAEEAGPTVTFEVTGADRPGIVHEVSRHLSSLGVSIVDLRTGTESAAMDGGALFRATAVVRLPDGVDAAGLAAGFERLSDDLMVDLVDG